ncbi:hypothetical protein KC351_g118 [Hortaea werneckii]|nr:hypothetical protein KC351_g118 [Hortaea werneckii]
MSSHVDVEKSKEKRIAPESPKLPSQWYNGQREGQNKKVDLYNHPLSASSPASSGIQDFFLLHVDPRSAVHADLSMPFSMPSNLAEQCWLLTLPKELRLQIYEYLLVQDDSVELSCLNNSQWKFKLDHRTFPLLRTCHQIRAEGMDVFYGSNVFRIRINKARPYGGAAAGPALEVLDRSPTSLARIRRVKFVAPVLHRGGALYATLQIDLESSRPEECQIVIDHWHETSDQAAVTRPRLQSPASLVQVVARCIEARATSDEAIAQALPQLFASLKAFAQSLRNVEYSQLDTAAIPEPVHLHPSFLENQPQHCYPSYHRQRPAECDWTSTAIQHLFRHLGSRIISQSGRICLVNLLDLRPTIDQSEPVRVIRYSVPKLRLTNLGVQAFQKIKLHGAVLQPAADALEVRREGDVGALVHFNHVGAIADSTEFAGLSASGSTGQVVNGVFGSRCDFVGCSDVPGEMRLVLSKRAREEKKGLEIHWRDALPIGIYKALHHLQGFHTRNTVASCQANADLKARRATVIVSQQQFTIASDKNIHPPGQCVSRAKPSGCNHTNRRCTALEHHIEWYSQWDMLQDKMMEMLMYCQARKPRLTQRYTLLLNPTPSFDQPCRPPIPSQSEDDVSSREQEEDDDEPGEETPANLVFHFNRSTPVSSSVLYEMNSKLFPLSRSGSSGGSGSSSFSSSARRPSLPVKSLLQWNSMIALCTCPSLPFFLGVFMARATFEPGDFRVQCPATTPCVISRDRYDLAHRGRIIGLVVYLFDAAHAGTGWALVGLRYTFRPLQRFADVDCVGCIVDARLKVLLEDCLSTRTWLQSKVAADMAAGSKSRADAECRNEGMMDSSRSWMEAINQMKGDERARKPFGGRVRAPSADHPETV